MLKTFVFQAVETWEIIKAKENVPHFGKLRNSFGKLYLFSFMFLADFIQQSFRC